MHLMLQLVSVSGADLLSATMFLEPWELRTFACFCISACGLVSCHVASCWVCYRCSMVTCCSSICVSWK